MKCAVETCNGKTVVYQTIVEHDPDRVVRMRTCKRCKRRWKTEEVAIGEIKGGIYVPFDHSDEQAFADVDGEPWYMENAFKRPWNADEEEAADG